MRPDRPSFTAAVVAFGRGVGLGGRRDPVARALLPAPFAQALDLIERAHVPGIVARVGTAGLVDHASLRMAAVDDATREALRDAIDQVAILGAGLDGRAWRMDALAGKIVFEIDHPATQAYKRERVAGLEPRAREVRFVPVDFARDRVEDALREAGHVAERPTLWLWEAVTMYLPRDAIAATLRALHQRSTEGSPLVMTYVSEAAMRVPVLSRIVRTAFDVLGEPLIGALEPAELRALLAEAGYTPLTDTGSADWAARWGGSAFLARPFASERLVTARAER